MRNFIITALTLGFLSGCTAMTKPINVKPDFTTIAGINSYVNSFRYISDKDNYGKSDYFATPEEFMAKKGGDCEDFAIMKASLIVKHGLAKEGDVVMVVVFDKLGNGGHAILYVNGKYLDNQTDLVLDQIRPWYEKVGIINYYAFIDGESGLKRVGLR